MFPSVILQVLQMIVCDLIREPPVINIAPHALVPGFSLPGVRFSDSWDIAQSFYTPIQTVRNYYYTRHQTLLSATSRAQKQPDTCKQEYTYTIPSPNKLAHHPPTTPHR